MNKIDWTWHSVLAACFKGFCVKINPVVYYPHAQWLHHLSTAGEAQPANRAIPLQPLNKELEDWWTELTNDSNKLWLSNILKNDRGRVPNLIIPEHTEEEEGGGEQNHTEGNVQMGESAQIGKGVWLQGENEMSLNDGGRNGRQVATESKENIRGMHRFNH